MIKFTPGPWEKKRVAMEGENERLFVEGKNQGKYVQIIPAIDIEVPEDEQNINLISASPDMYDALQMVCVCDCGDHKDDGNIKCKSNCFIGKALRKAEGRE